MRDAQQILNGSSSSSHAIGKDQLETTELKAVSSNAFHKTEIESHAVAPSATALSNFRLNVRKPPNQLTKSILKEYNSASNNNIEQKVVKSSAESKKATEEQITINAMRENIELAIQIECVHVVCDIVEFTESQLVNRSMYPTHEYLILVSLIFSVCAIFAAVIVLKSKKIKNIIIDIQPLVSEVEVVGGGRRSGNSNENEATLIRVRQWYQITSIVYLIIIDVFRFEILLYSPEVRLWSIILTLILNIILQRKVQVAFANIFYSLITAYLQIRFLVEKNDFVFLFVNASIITVFSSIMFLKDVIQIRLPPLKSFRISQLISENEKSLKKQELNSQYKKLKQSEYLKRFYHRIVSMMPQGVLIVDSTENLIYANKTSKKILNCSKKATIMETLKSLIVKNLAINTNTTQKNNEMINEMKKVSKTMRTLKSLQSMHSMHLRRGGTALLPVESQADSESLVSAFHNMYQSPCIPKRLSIVKQNERRHASSISQNKAFQKSISMFSNKDGIQQIGQNSSHTAQWSLQTPLSSLAMEPDPSPSSLAVVTPQGNQLTYNQTFNDYHNNNNGQIKNNSSQFQSPFRTISDELQEHQNQSKEIQAEMQKNSDQNNFEGMSVFEIIQLLLKKQSQRKKAAIKAEEAEKSKQKKEKQINSIRQEKSSVNKTVFQGQLGVQYSTSKNYNACGQEEVGRSINSENEQQNSGRVSLDIPYFQNNTNNNKRNNNDLQKDSINESSIEFTIPQAPPSLMSSTQNANKTLFSFHSYNPNIKHAAAAVSRPPILKRKQSLQKTGNQQSQFYRQKSHHALQPSTYSTAHTKEKIIRQQSSNPNVQIGSLRSISHYRHGEIPVAPNVQSNQMNGGSITSSWAIPLPVVQTVNNGIPTSGVGNTIKRNTEIAQNSVSVRIQLNEKIIEITFVDCDNSEEESTNINNNNNNNMVEEKKKGNNNNNNNKKSDKRGGDKGNESFIIVFFEDITNEVYTRRLEELNQYKMWMLSSVSHELKTPLNCSMGMLEELDQYIMSGILDDQQETVEQMRSLIIPAQQSNVLLLSMIRDLLDLGTLEMGDLKFSFTMFNLKETLQSHCSVMTSQAELKNIEIEFIYDTNIDEDVVSDETRLSQIMINFLTNSLKFTGKNGKVILRVESYRGTHFKISVEDNGIGISKQKISELFQVFSDFTQTISPKPSTHGIGIGLSVSHRLAQGLTLDEFKEKPIQVISEEHKGSIFSFFLKNQEIRLTDDNKDSIHSSVAIDAWLDPTGSQFKSYATTQKEQLPFDSSEDSQTGDKENSFEEREIHVPYIKPRWTKVDYAQGRVKKSKSKPIREMTFAARNANTTVYDEEGNEVNCEDEDDQENDDDQGERQSHYESGLENIEAEEENEYLDGLESRFLPTDSGRLKNYQASHFNQIEKYFSDPEDCVMTSQLPSQSQRDTNFITSGPSDTLSPNYSSTLLPILLDQHALSIRNGGQKFSTPSTTNVDENSNLVKINTSKYTSSQTIGTHCTTGQIVGQNIVKKPTQRMSLTSSGNFGQAIGSEQSQILELFIIQNQAKQKKSLPKQESSLGDLDQQMQFGDLLIVDDVQFNLMTLQSLLKRYGLAVDVAHDGQEAIDRVRDKFLATQQMYKIIFMDIQMPIKDGFEATEEIRKFIDENAQVQIPIVATSAFNDASYKEHAKKVGMTDYIEKPIKHAALDRSFLKYVIKYPSS